MTVTAAFCPLSLQTLFDRNSCPIVGGAIYFYDAQTTNARPVYRDAALQTPFPSPIRTDGFGRIPPIWVDVGNYKVVLNDNRNVLISSVDDLPGGTEVTPAVVVSNYWNTGDMKFAHGTDQQDGWLIANAETVGGPNSAATSRANDDTQDLFVHLWNEDPSLAVSGGRGVSASSDFAGAKTIALPDYRGRGARGVDQMGAGLTAGVITSATTATPNQVGTEVGSENVTLTGDNLPAIAPTITIDGGQPGGAHVHAATSDQQGQHTHETTENPHTHSVGTNTAGGTVASPNQGGSQVTLSADGSIVTSATATGLSINSAGLHNHNVTVASSSHTHTATSSNLGSGSAHSNVPPDMLGTWYIKL